MQTKVATGGFLAFDHDWKGSIFVLLCSVDATKESGRLGRLVNHSKTKSNVVTKVVEVGGTPHLCLMASRDIAVGEELQYDYGERKKEIVESLPWLGV